MAAVYVSNLSINVGATFSQSFTLADAASDSVLDLTGYAHSAALRKHFLATTSTPFQTTVSDPTTGVISVSMGSTLTSTLKPGRYVYDLVIETGGTKTRAVEGTVLVRGGVTR
jgi:hypothetical protein